MSRRIAAVAVLATLVALGAAALVAVAGGDRRHVAFSTAVPPTQAGALVFPGTTTCETAIHVDGAFDALRLGVGSVPPGPETIVTVRRAGTRTRLATGVIPAGFAKSRRLGFQAVRLSRSVHAGGYADVCVQVRGRMGLFLAGHRDPAGRVVVILGRGRERRFATDIHLEFVRTRPRSVLSQVPTIFHRAALFRADPIGAWTYWALLAIVLVAVPLLIARAVWTAGEDAPDGESARLR